GCFISAPGGDWDTIILEGGYLAGSSQSINWGIKLIHCQGGRIKNLLALPERSFYTQPFIMMVDNSTNNDQWVEIEQIGFLMDPPSSKVTIDNCTIAGRDGSAFQLRNVYNLDINYCAIKGC